MAVVKINLSCELTEAVKVQYLRGNLFSQDNQANVINVAVFEGGEPTELAGTVTANVIRPDGGTVAVTGGTYSGNVATITMPSAVYAIPGAISVAVKITLDSVVTTIAAFAATVYATSTDTAVDPGTIIPSIQTLIAEIEAAVDSIPADYSSLWATLAPNYSNLTFPVAVGQYCTYNGGFYRCNTAIATQEAWTAAHWTATNIGADLAETRLDVANIEDDVSELKSAIGVVPEGENLQGEVDDLEKKISSGESEDFTAGNALYLLSDRGDTDVAPYVFRKTGGAKNGYGREFLRKIVGGTVAWNQLMQNGNFESATGWEGTGSASLSVSDNVATLSFTGTPSSYYGNSIRNALNKGANHVLLLTSMVMASKSGQVETGITNATGSMRIEVTADVWTRSDKIVKRNSTISCNVMFCNGNNYAQYGNGDYIKVKKVNVFDLTQMFGSTIADAIYAMEQATAGSGVAWFRSLFPNSYYAYDAGSLQSVQAKEHRTVGFNQWDEETRNGYYKLDGTFIENSSYIANKNPIPVIPSTQYNITSLSGWIGRICWYDANNAFLSTDTNASASVQWAVTSPANARYLSFDMMSVYGGTYKNDICINLSDPAKNGTYEPYAGHVYPLDSDLVLRGIPKWDSTNGLYYDGDEYASDGSVKRKYGIVDLSTLSWEATGSTGHLVVSNGISNLIKKPASDSVVGSMISEKYNIIPNNYGKKVLNDLCVAQNGAIYIYCESNTSFTISGHLVYELATPTIESADAFRELQISAHGGTEEFVDAGVTASTPTRDVSIPVGTETFYPVDIWHLIDELTALVLEN